MSIFSQWLKKPLGSKKNVFRQIAPYAAATYVTAKALSYLAPKNTAPPYQGWNVVTNTPQTITPAKPSFFQNVWAGAKVAGSAVNTGLDWTLTGAEKLATGAINLGSKALTVAGLIPQKPIYAATPTDTSAEYVYNPWAENVPASQFSSNPDLVAAAADGGGGAESGGQGIPEPITAGGLIMGLLVAGVIVSMLLHKKGEGAPGIP